MKAEKKADIIETEFLVSGHSHNEMDQRFSSVALRIHLAPSLETPGEFRDWILKEVTPARGRELHVEVLEGTWDVRTWLHDADVQIKGLAATHKEPDACHVWRMVSRSHLTSLGLTDASVVCLHDDWKSLEPHADDVILLVKRRMSSMELAQEPLLMLPVSVSAQLDYSKLKPSVTNELGDTMCRELRKTAKLVAAQPWNLMSAANYLETLCDQNEKREIRQPPPLDFLLNYKMVEAPRSLLPAFVLEEGSTEVPRLVQVLKPDAVERRSRAKAQAKGEVAKRPAAAPAAGEHAEADAAHGEANAGSEEVDATETEDEAGRRLCFHVSSRPAGQRAG